ncbi:MAG: hypothetical protein HKP61_21120 [Dactylosporangium sp.]|nr:hypothetical protein [Dactylosporangium sp.]NNJ63383.1 hypothetical protein [Dactylosporangium sp.]
MSDGITAFLHERIDSAKYVEEIHSVFHNMSTSPQYYDDIRRAIDYLVDGRLSTIEGSPSEWFNLAIQSRMVNNIAGGFSIIQEAVRRYPEDVDLLCELFQFRYNHGDQALAAEVWERLNELGKAKTGPSWRFWVYGATYLARYLHDREGALALLEEGLSWVRLADLNNVFSHYRIVLIDGADLRAAGNRAQVAELHTRYVDLIQQRYKDGLELGIECGYVLAVDLAKLLRERSAGMDPESASECLDVALRYLDVAERTYTHNGNHPIWNIYIEKAITLMARRRYADALQVFRSLPPHKLDGRLETMARYAANTTGQTFAASGESEDSSESGRVDRIDARVKQIDARVEQLEGAVMQLIGSLSGQNVK